MAVGGGIVRKYYVLPSDCYILISHLYADVLVVLSVKLGGFAAVFLKYAVG
jgi:hypothetical protein